MSRLKPITNGGSTIGISRTVSTRLFPRNSWRESKYPSGTATIKESNALIVHEIRLSLMAYRISGVASARVM